MTAEFPTTIPTTTDPAGDNKLNSPDHASLHSKENDEIKAIATKVGTGASTPAAGKVLRASGTGTSAWGQIQTADITDANVTASKLATDSVETAKIKDANVSADKLASNAVTTAKILNSNVTTEKIADSAITTSKLAVKHLAGWDLLAAAGTRVSATQLTITGDVTAYLAVGLPVEFTDTTTKYGCVLSFSYSAPNTTVNLVAINDYALVGNPTNIYFGNRPNPAGFPYWFSGTTTFYKDDGTTACAGTLGLYKYNIKGRDVTLKIITSAIADPAGTKIYFSLPFTAITSGNTYQVVGSCEAVGAPGGVFVVWDNALTKCSVLRPAYAAWAGSGNSFNGTLNCQI